MSRGNWLSENHIKSEVNLKKKSKKHRKEKLTFHKSFIGVLLNITQMHTLSTLLLKEFGRIWAKSNTDSFSSPKLNTVAVHTVLSNKNYINLLQIMLWQSAFSLPAFHLLTVAVRLKQNLLLFLALNNIQIKQKVSANKPNPVKTWHRSYRFSHVRFF